MFSLSVLLVALLQTASVSPATQQSASTQQSAPHLSSNDVAQLQAKAEAGDAAAQLALGRAYQKGDGIRQNDELAVMWYRKAADQGNAIAQNNLGIMYRMGSGVEKNKEEAVKWYRLAARQGDANAMFNLGTAYYNGDGTASNEFQAYDWFLVAEEAGSTNAPDAVQRTAAEIGPRLSVVALMDVAGMYEAGRDLPRNYVEVEKWYRKAIALKNPTAMVRLAALYINGKGVSQDYPQALALCRDAAKMSAGGQHCVGYMYQHGLGVPADPKEAAKWYLSSADGGNSDSMLAIAQMYWKGDGINVDRAEAYYWFFDAYRHGERDAQRMATDTFKEMDQNDKKRLDKALRKRHLDPKTVFETVNKDLVR
jgi:uncharacterized protein